jgi:hypothetical protein
LKFEIKSGCVSEFRVAISRLGAVVVARIDKPTEISSDIPVELRNCLVGNEVKVKAPSLGVVGCLFTDKGKVERLEG